MKILRDPPKPSVAEWLALPVFFVVIIAMIIAVPLTLAVTPDWLTHIVTGLCGIVSLLFVFAMSYGLWWKWRQWRHSPTETTGDKS
jgi:membrane protein implicated in regulation of membrane protease activity